MEQMGFLEGRRIQDLHSIKKKKMKALVLKLDVRKESLRLH
jgi:hypothetical protein